MISIKVCREYLRGSGLKLDDDTIRELRDLLVLVAEIDYERMIALTREEEQAERKAEGRRPGGAGRPRPREPVSVDACRAARQRLNGSLPQNQFAAPYCWAGGYM